MSNIYLDTKDLRPVAKASLQHEALKKQLFSQSLSDSEKQNIPENTIVDESYLQESAYNKKRNVFTSTQSSFAPKITDSYINYEPEGKSYLIKLIQSTSNHEKAQPARKQSVRQLYEKKKKQSKAIREYESSDSDTESPMGAIDCRFKQHIKSAQLIEELQSKIGIAQIDFYGSGINDALLGRIAPYICSVRMLSNLEYIDFGATKLQAQSICLIFRGIVSTAASARMNHFPRALRYLYLNQMSNVNFSELIDDLTDLLTFNCINMEELYLKKNQIDDKTATHMIRLLYKKNTDRKKIKLLNLQENLLTREFLREYEVQASLANLVYAENVKLEFNNITQDEILYFTRHMHEKQTVQPATDVNQAISSDENIYKRVFGFGFDGHTTQQHALNNYSQPNILSQDTSILYQQPIPAQGLASEVVHKQFNSLQVNTKQYSYEPQTRQNVNQTLPPPSPDVQQFSYNPVATQNVMQNSIQPLQTTEKIMIPEIPQVDVEPIQVEHSMEETLKVSTITQNQFKRQLINKLSQRQKALQQPTQQSVVNDETIKTQTAIKQKIVSKFEQKQQEPELQDLKSSLRQRIKNTLAQNQKINKEIDLMVTQTTLSKETLSTQANKNVEFIDQPTVLSSQHIIPDIVQQPISTTNDQNQATIIPEIQINEPHVQTNYQQPILTSEDQMFIQQIRALLQVNDNITALQKIKGLIEEVAAFKERDEVFEQSINQIKLLFTDVLDKTALEPHGSIQEDVIQLFTHLYTIKHLQ